MVDENILNNIMKLLTEGNYLESANECRKALSENPQDEDYLDAFARIENSADVFYMEKITSSLASNNFSDAIIYIKEWLRVVGERNDLYSLLEEILIKRKQYGVDRKERQIKEANEIKTALEAAIEHNDLKEALKLFEEYSVIGEPDPVLEEKLNRRINEFSDKRNKDYRKMYILDSLFFVLGVIILLISIFNFSSDIGFLVGVIMILVSIAIALILTFSYYLFKPVTR